MTEKSIASTQDCDKNKLAHVELSESEQIKQFLRESKSFNYLEKSWGKNGGYVELMNNATTFSQLHDSIHSEYFHHMKWPADINRNLSGRSFIYFTSFFSNDSARSYYATQLKEEIRELLKDKFTPDYKTIDMAKKS